MIELHYGPPVFLLSGRPSLQQAALQIADHAGVACLISATPNDIISALANRALVLIGEDLAEKAADFADRKLVGWQEGLFLPEIARVILLVDPDDPEHSVGDTPWMRRVVHASQVIAVPFGSEDRERLAKVLSDLNPPF